MHLVKYAASNLDHIAKEAKTIHSGLLILRLVYAAYIQGSSRMYLYGLKVTFQYKTRKLASHLKYLPKHIESQLVL